MNLVFFSINQGIEYVKNIPNLPKTFLLCGQFLKCVVLSMDVEKKFFSFFFINFEGKCTNANTMPYLPKKCKYVFHINC